MNRHPVRRRRKPQARNAVHHRVHHQRHHRPYRQRDYAHVRANLARRAQRLPCAQLRVSARADRQRARRPTQHHPRKDPRHPPRLPPQREALTHLQGTRRGGADAAKDKGDLRPITLAASAPPPHRNSQISAKQKAQPGLITQAALAFPSIYQRKFAKTGYIDIVWNLPSITALP